MLARRQAKSFKGNAIHSNNFESKTKRKQTEDATIAAATQQPQANMKERRAIASATQQADVGFGGVGNSRHAGEGPGVVDITRMGGGLAVRSQRVETSLPRP